MLRHTRVKIILYNVHDCCGLRNTCGYSETAWRTFYRRTKSVHVNSPEIGQFCANSGASFSVRCEENSAKHFSMQWSVFFRKISDGECARTAGSKASFSELSLESPASFASFK
jgi:hypothetical protein